MSDYLSIFLMSFVGELFLVLTAFLLFPKLKLMDKPQKYGLTRKPIPYGGGILIYLVFFVMTIVFLPLSEQLAGILTATTLVVLVSFIDDFFCLPAWPRLVMQLVATGIVIGSGTAIHYLSNPLGGVFDFSALPFLGVIMTLVWVIFVMNMINWVDGINGLSSGISTITSFSIFLLAIRPDFHTIDQTLVVYMSIIIAAAALAFWFFEFYPARILMGDTGSMFLGFMIAILAIVSGAKLATAFLVLAIPILDGSWVILRRLYEKKSPLKGDLTHFHHRLLQLGMKPQHILVLYYSLTALFGIIALFFGSQTKLMAIGFLVLAMFAVEFFILVVIDKKV